MSCTSPHRRAFRSRSRRHLRSAPHLQIGNLSARSRVGTIQGSKPSGWLRPESRRSSLDRRLCMRPVPAMVGTPRVGRGSERLIRDRRCSSPVERRCSRKKWWNQSCCCTSQRNRESGSTAPLVPRSNRGWLGRNLTGRLSQNSGCKSPNHRESERSIHWCPRSIPGTPGRTRSVPPGRSKCRGRIESHSCSRNPMRSVPGWHRCSWTAPSGSARSPESTE